MTVSGIKLTASGAAGVVGVVESAEQPTGPWVERFRSAAASFAWTNPDPPVSRQRLYRILLADP